MIRTGKHRRPQIGVAHGDKGMEMIHVMSRTNCTRIDEKEHGRQASWLFIEMLKVVSRTKTNAITFGAFVMTCSTRGSSSADRRLVEETNDLAGNVLAAGLLVVHDTGGGGQDDVTELTRGKELDNPLLHVAELDVVAGGDDTGLVEAAVELDNNLAVAVVIDLLELANVACEKKEISDLLGENKQQNIIEQSEAV